MCGIVVHTTFASTDLRQDMLTLQAFNQMEDVWKGDQLEYGMIPYKCLSAGDKIGFIQVRGETIPMHGGDTSTRLCTRGMHEAPTFIR